MALAEEAVLVPAAPAPFPSADEAARPFFQIRVVELGSSIRSFRACGIGPPLLRDYGGASAPEPPALVQNRSKDFVPDPRIEDPLESPVEDEVHIRVVVERVVHEDPASSSSTSSCRPSDDAGSGASVELVEKNDQSPAPPRGEDERLEVKSRCLLTDIPELLENAGGLAPIAVVIETEVPVLAGGRPAANALSISKEQRRTFALDAEEQRLYFVKDFKRFPIYADYMREFFGDESKVRRVDKQEDDITLAEAKVDEEVDRFVRMLAGMEMDAPIGAKFFTDPPRTEERTSDPLEIFHHSKQSFPRERSFAFDCGKLDEIARLLPELQFLMDKVGCEDFHGQNYCLSYFEQLLDFCGSEALRVEERQHVYRFGVKRRKAS